MIGWLAGRVVSQQGETLVVDVNGVGYAVTASASVLGKLSGDYCSVELIIFTDVRENSIALYGFSDQLEREVFLLLKKVKGIGSKVALCIVSWFHPEQVLAAIGQADLTALQSVPGVGKKLAERIVVELREYVGELAREVVVPLTQRIERNVSVQRLSGPASIPGDVVLALEKLGFSSDRARDVVARVIEEHANSPALHKTDELLRLSLANL